jgi:hypothetical protein
MSLARAIATPKRAHPQRTSIRSEPAIALGTEAIRAFAKSILHGDQAHKDWLLAAEAFVAGKKVPTPPRLLADQVYQWFGPQGDCPRCDRRRKAEGYWHKD